jgi:surface protein
LFGSPVGTAHPLTGTNTIPVIAGYWVPVIRYATIGGITYTSTPRSGYNSAIDLATCLNPIQVQNFNCTNGTVGTGNYTHLVAYQNGTQLASEASKTIAFDLDGTVQYFAYFFNGYIIADRLKFSYVSGATETVMHDLVIGTDNATDNYTVTPKLVKRESYKDVINLTPFIYTPGDYIKITITASYNAPANANTNWDLSMKCLATFSLNYTKPILDVCHPTLAYDTNACRYTLDMQFAQYPAITGTGANQDTNASSDLMKYIGVYGYYDGAYGGYTWTSSTLNIRTYLNNKASCGSSNVGSTGNTNILAAGGYTISKTGTTGNVTYTYVFSQQADYDSYYNDYFTAMAIHVPGYTPSNRTFTLPSNTTIDYYKYVLFRVRVANTPGDTIINKDFFFHYGTFVNFDNATKTISLTLANIAYGYITPELCPGSSGLATNCGTLGVSDHNGANTINTSGPAYSYTTYIKVTGSSYGARWAFTAPTLVNPMFAWIQDYIVAATWGSIYSVFGTSTIPTGWCRDSYPGNVSKFLRSYRHFYRATITNTADALNNYKIETLLDANGCYTGVGITGNAIYTTVYEISGGAVITQNCSNVPQFVSTWRTTTFNETITLPLVDPAGGANYSGTIYWGDGTSTALTNANWNTANTHTYLAGGDYVVRIYANPGSLTGWKFNNTGDKLKIRNVLHWGSLRFLNDGAAFMGCSNLTLSTVDDTPDFTGITSLNNMFRDCGSITTINNVSLWNVSSVTNFNATFLNNYLLNDNFGSWNMSAATNIGSMFNTCSNFNNGGSSTINNWNVSSVANMANVFENCIVFNQPVGNWNTANVVNMQGMFNTARAFNQDITNWRVGNVFYMNNMFQNTDVFNQDISKWERTTPTTSTLATVINMSNMFFNALVFNQNINNWNVSNVTDMSGMFHQAFVFNQNLNSWNTGNVTTMANMFENANVFNGNITSWNTSKVTTMYRMFADSLGTGSAFNQAIGSWNTGLVTTMQEMFYKAFAFNQSIGGWNVSNVTNLTGFMEFKTSADYSTANYNALLNAWSLQTLQPSVIAKFGSIQYTIVGASAARIILTSAPNNWTITDGGGI